MTTDERILAIRSYLTSARKNVLAWPNESALVRQNCNREIEFQMAALRREGFAGYEVLRAEIQEAWERINKWRNARQAEAIDRGLNYKKSWADGGKTSAA